MRFKQVSRQQMPDFSPIELFFGNEKLPAPEIRD